MASVTKPRRTKKQLADTWPTLSSLKLNHLPSPLTLRKPGDPLAFEDLKPRVSFPPKLQAEADELIAKIDAAVEEYAEQSELPELTGDDYRTLSISDINQEIDRRRDLVLKSLQRFVHLSSLGIDLTARGIEEWESEAERVRKELTAESSKVADELSAVMGDADVLVLGQTVRKVPKIKALAQRLSAAESGPLNLRGLKGELMKRRHDIATELRLHIESLRRRYT